MDFYFFLTIMQLLLILTYTIYNKDKLKISAIIIHFVVS